MFVGDTTDWHAGRGQLGRDGAGSLFLGFFIIYLFYFSWRSGGENHGGEGFGMPVKDIPTGGLRQHVTCLAKPSAGVGAQQEVEREARSDRKLM